MKRSVLIVCFSFLVVTGGCARKADSTVFVNLIPYNATSPDEKAMIRISQNRSDPSVFEPNPPSRVKGKDEDVFVRARLFYPTKDSRTLEIESTYKGSKKTITLPLEASEIHEVDLPGDILSVVGISEKKG